MTKEQAIQESKGLREYYPFRIHFIYTMDEIEWFFGVGKTMARANNYAREGYKVFILKGEEE